MLLLGSLYVNEVLEILGGFPFWRSVLVRNYF